MSGAFFMSFIFTFFNGSGWTKIYKREQIRISTPDRHMSDLWLEAFPNCFSQNGPVIMIVYFTKMQYICKV